MMTLSAPVAANLKTLKNQLLIATPSLQQTPFDQAVVFIAHHGADGAMGFIINQPLRQLAFNDVARSMGIEEMMAKGREQPILFKGGPMENTRGFVIHSTDYALQSSVKINHDFTLSAQSDIVGDIARGSGPKDVTFCLGYSGWAPGQLEEELKGNDWLLLPATPRLVFEAPPTSRYALATQMVGFDPLHFHGEIVGRA
jgi:putative transcriptional regulator